MEAIVCYCVEFQQKIGCKVHSYWLRLFEEAMNLVFFCSVALIAWFYWFYFFAALTEYVCVCFGYASIVQMLWWKICTKNTHAHGINMNFYWCVFAFTLWKLWQATWRKVCVLHSIGKRMLLISSDCFFYRKRRNEQEWDRERKLNIKKNYIEVVGNMHVQK